MFRHSCYDLQSAVVLMLFASAVYELWQKKSCGKIVAKQNIKHMNMYHLTPPSASENSLASREFFVS